MNALPSREALGERVNTYAELARERQGYFRLNFDFEIAVKLRNIAALEKKDPDSRLLREKRKIVNMLIALRAERFPTVRKNNLVLPE